MSLALADAQISIWLLVLLGFIVGTLSGFFGVGGAFIMTPALNILGLPMVQAIGTDLALMVGSSTVATLRHFRFGHVDLRLGLYMLAGTAAGVWLGKTVVFALIAAGGSDAILRGIFIFLLFGLSAWMIRDYYAFLRLPRRRAKGERLGTGLSRRLLSLRLAPQVDFPVSGLRDVSLWVPVGLGLVTGFLAALLGVGGGFIRMPALIYGVGIPTTVAVGTDLFEIIFSSAFGAYLYALEGQVNLPAAMIMLLGATLGAEMGSYATRHVRGMRIRLYFALTILGAGVSVVLKQLDSWFDRPWLAEAAAYLIVGVATVMVIIIVTKLVAGLYDRRSGGRGE